MKYHRVVFSKTNALATLVAKELAEQGGTGLQLRESMVNFYNRL